MRSRWGGRFARRRSDLEALVLLVLLALLPFWRVVLRGEVLLPLDMLATVEPWKSESPDFPRGPAWNPEVTDAIWAYYPTFSWATEQWRSGAPLWDPYTLAGMPGLASGEMYAGPALQLLGLVLSPARAMSFSAVLHLLLGLLLAYALCRALRLAVLPSLLGAVVCGLNLYAVVWMSFPPLYGAMAWTPALFLGVVCAERFGDWPWAAAGGVAFALQISEGFLLLSVYAAVGLALVCAWQSARRLLERRSLAEAARPLAWGALSGVVGLALASPLLALGAELFRRTGRVDALFAKVALPPKVLLRLLVPDAFGSSLHGGQYWGPVNYVETALYVGLVPLLLVVVALLGERRREAAPFAVLGLLFVLAVLGVPLVRPLVELLFPVLVRSSPARIFHLTVFFWGLAAAFGLDSLIRRRPPWLLRALCGVCLAGGVAALTLGIALVGREFEQGRSLVPLEVAEGMRLVRLQGLASATLCLALAAVAFAALGSRRFRAAAAGLVLVAALDLLLVGARFNPSFPEALAFPETPSTRLLADLLAAEEQPVRVATVHGMFVLPGQAPERYRLPVPTGYTSWVPRRYARYMQLTGQLAARGGPVQVYLEDCCAPLLDAHGVRYVIASPSAVPGGSGLSLLARLREARIEDLPPRGVHATAWQLDGVPRPVIYAPPPARLRYAFAGDEAGTLVTAVGIEEGAWSAGGDGATFRILGRALPAGESEVLFARHLDPRNEADRRWVRLEVDLSRFAGRPFELTLDTDPGPRHDPSFDWAGWLDPHIEGVGPPPALELIQDGPVRIYRNHRALPRAWIVHRVDEVPPAAEGRVVEILDRGLDLRRRAVVEGSVSGPLSAASVGTDEVRFVSYAAERVELATRSAAPGWLVLSDSYFPGWAATVDGRATDVQPTDLALRGIYLPAGEHTVVFTYEPGSLRWSLPLSALALVCLVVASIWRSRRASERRAGSAGL